MINEFKYVEYRQKVYREKDERPTILHIHELPAGGGFRSCYQINEEGKKWIEERGSVGGFGESGIPVWAPYLYVDFDSCPEEAEYLRGVLIHDQIAFEMYDSGNRSIHFHIRRDVSPSPDLPYSDRQCIKRLAPKADTTLYSALHPFRLPGTSHEKTGKQKLLIESYDGNPLPITLIRRPDFNALTKNKPIVSIFEDSIVMGLSRGFREGNRYKNTLVLAYKLLERGESPAMIESWIRNVNLLSSPPLPEERLQRIFRSVLRGRENEE